MVKKTKMENAPVYYCLAQVQFNPIAVMDKYINEIQDSLRQSGYTLFESQTNTLLRFSNLQGESEPKSIKTNLWLITKRERNSGFMFTESSVIFHTTHYETHNELFSELLRGLRIINKVVKLSHISRLGLRYLNAVLPSSNEEVNQYLVKGLHGIEFSANRNYSLNESVFQTEGGPLFPVGKLIFRVQQINSILSYPPGITPYGLLLMKKFDVKESLQHAIIDIDHYVEGIMDLDFENTQKQLLSLHNVIRNSFEASITSYAKSKWF